MNIKRINATQLKEIIKKSLIRVITEEYCENQSSDENFDLDRIPIDILDKGWTRYHPYIYTIDHRNPLANRAIEEGTDYKSQITLIKDAITSTFPIDDSQFIIKEGNNGLYAAILVALTDDNIDIIEDAMERKGFFRSQPTNDKLLVDRKNRKWLDVRFEPKMPDDVTEEVHSKYTTLFHFTPSLFEDKVKENGLTVSNNNPDYRYSESRAFLAFGDMSMEDKMQLVNTLYTQAQRRRIPNLTPNYSLFSFDLTQMGNDIRFFYDINEPKGLYTKVPIPAKFIQNIEHITANINDRIP